uniref:Putative transcriptional regulator brca1 n=1 Tax=Ixodes ricinus TaxID=34613 RepID=A0A131Y195_IXORI
MTSIPPEDREVVRSVVLALGGFQVEAEVTPRTTHLVVGGAVRTLNLLSAMARGCWVLSTDWVYRSLEAGHWLDERPFELGEMFPAVRLSRQDRAERRRDEGGLLAGTGAIYVSPESRPPPDKLRQLVQILGGKVAPSYLRCNVALGPVEASKRRPDVRHVSEKWLLDSISEHRVLPFSGYC